MEDELFLKFLRKCLKYWEYRDVLYNHRPKSLFLFLLVDKILMELNHCSCNTLDQLFLVNQLLLELNHRVKNHKEEILRLNTTLSIVILNLVVDLMY